METITNDQTGEKFEITMRKQTGEDQFVYYCQYIIPAQKTIVQVAAEKSGSDEPYVRGCLPYIQRLIFDAIEQRLQAIERRLERSDARATATGDRAEARAKRRSSNGYRR